MGILRAIADLPEKMAEAYVDWYRQRYIPEHGDLATNTRELWVNLAGESFFRPYSSTNSRRVPVGTALVCVGFRETVTGVTGYIFRFDDMDAVLPERLIVYIRVASRQRSAHG